MSALKAQLPLDNQAIDRFRTDDAAWRMWDADQSPGCNLSASSASRMFKWLLGRVVGKLRSGYIEYIEIMDEDKGLLKFVRDSFARAAHEAAIPDLRRDRDAWYRPAMPKEQVGCRSSRVCPAQNGMDVIIRDTEALARIPVAYGWVRYWDEDGSGELEFEEVVRAFAKTFKIDVDAISQLRESLGAVWGIFDTDNSGAVDRHEFMAPNDGLADTVLATMRYQ